MHEPSPEKDGKVEPLSNFVKGDEIELAHSQKDGKFSPEEWERQKLIYVGRKTLSRYGCYGCHDIPGFEDAGPIGMALQDWGRKDTSKLAPEHIAEYLHHHGEVDGSSTLARVEEAIDRQKNDGNASPADLSAAFFVDSLLHHGRPGFVWQKLRDPRSYDYKKIETKGWDERLRMPKFPFSEQQIESVATSSWGSLQILRHRLISTSRAEPKRSPRRGTPAVQVQLRRLSHSGDARIQVRSLSG